MMDVIPVVSPFDRLPEEVLIHIFSFYLQSEGHKKFLLNVAPVCKKWHQLGSMPQLWSVIRESLKLDDLVKFSQKGFLTHTRSLEISGSYEWPYFLGYDDDDQVLNLILNCHNLKAIRLSHIRRSRVLLTLLRIRFPHLASLELDCVCERYFDYGLPRGKLYSNTLKSVYYACGGHLKIISLSNIEIAGDELMMNDIAECCPYLEEFHLHHVCLNNKYCCFPVTKFQQNCPRLRVIKLDNCHLVYQNISEMIGFPCLETFEMLRCFEALKLKPILGKSQNLRTLNLGYCTGVTCQNVLEIPSRKLLRLSLFHVETCNTDLDRIVSRWKSTLRELRLIDMSSQSIRDSLLALMHQNPKPLIEVIELRSLFYSNICYSVLKTVKDKCSRLKEFSIWKPKTCGHFTEVKKNFFEVGPR